MVCNSLDIMNPDVVGCNELEGGRVSSYGVERSSFGLGLVMVDTDDDWPSLAGMKIA